MDTAAPYRDIVAELLVRASEDYGTRAAVLLELALYYARIATGEAGQDDLGIGMKLNRTVH